MVDVLSLNHVWILALIKLGVFSSVLAYTVLLNKVSRINETKHFSLSMFFFAFSSVFEILGLVGTKNLTIVEISQFGIQLCLFVAGIFLVKFFLLISKNSRLFR